MSLRHVLRTQHGQQVILGKQLGSGGEGIVYEVQSAPSLAAKIYHPDKAAERAQKVAAMVSAGWHKTAKTAAFPVDALFAGPNHFVGFTMPLVSGQREIHDLYSPTSRRTAFPTASFRFLVRTSLNIARAVAGVQATGCVIGDLNQSGILIAPNAIATLIDCDSFQVTVGGQTFVCKVGKEEFTPPELQGKRFDQIVRTPNHDAFGLAVIIFYLLFMGRHPFAGKFLGRGDLPMQIAIAEYRFAYSARTHETRMQPPPHVPLLSDLPKELSDAFEMAFGQAGASRRRPTVAEWVSMLTRAEQEIASCQNSPAHHFFRTGAPCPWCRMETAYPGFLAFVPQIAHISQIPINLAQLIAAVRGVPNPGIATDLPTLMPNFSGSPSPVAASFRGLGLSYAAGVIGVFAVVLLVRLEVLPPQMGLLFLGLAVFLAIRQPQALEALEKALSQATTAWRNVEARWQQFRDNRSFLDRRRDADDTIRQLQDLPNQERKELAELKQRQHEAQLIAFLEQFYIDHPSTKIKGVGSSRKIMLQSYGIETAADVQQSRIQQISGFGPVITGAIIAWRKSLERRFIFNPNQPIDPAAIAAVKARIAKRYVQLHKKLQDALAELQTLSGQVQASRTHLRNTALSVWNAKRQADLDAATYLKLFSVRNRLIAVSVATVAALMLSITRAPLARIPPASSSQAKPWPRTENVPSTVPSRQTHSGDEPATNTTVPTVVPQPPPRIESNPPVSAQQQVNTTPPPSPMGGAGPPIAIEPQEPAPSPVLPQGDRNPASAQKPGLAPVLDASTPNAILAIQTRLRALGYAAPLTRVWESATRDALRDFKIANHLDPSDVWDLSTQEQLASNSATPIARSFIGNWSISECRLERDQDAPLSINSRRARSSGGACEFLKISYSGPAWRIQALCQVDKERWSANITLTLSGNQLTWASERGIARYFRCN